MRFLIDTQILIWIISETHKISSEVKAILLENEIFVSQVSFFEIAIKQNINKLSGITSSVAEIREQSMKDGIQILEIGAHHIDAYNSIPLLADHRDPFDRLLISTAIS